MSTATDKTEFDPEALLEDLQGYAKILGMLGLSHDITLEERELNALENMLIGLIKVHGLENWQDAKARS